MDCQHRARRELLWDTFVAPNKSGPNSPPNRKSARNPAFVGHRKIESTVRYLGIEVDDALAIAERVDV
jgi:hypothetical protein